MGKFQEGYKVAKQKFQQAADARGTFVPRFRLPMGKSGKLIFLTDKPVLVEEHSIPQRSRDGTRKFFQPVTSPATFGNEDPLKDAGSRTSVVAYYTVVELGTWKDRQGNVHKNEKKLLGLKEGVFDKVRRKRARIIRKSKEEGKDRTLRLALFKTYRTKQRDGKSPATGDDWEYIKHLSSVRVKELIQMGLKEGEATLDPLDYDTLLAPPADKELQRLAKAFEAAQNRRSGKDDFDDDEDEEEEKPKKRRPKDEDEEEEEEEEEDEETDKGIFD